MQPLLVRTADVPAQPWKNGGGVTRELLALPAGDDWRVRVSVAEVASDGAFSTFVGVDRWFA
ncbi:MAG TPA: HutD family protein, partial [Caldimonas sp.]